MQADRRLTGDSSSQRYERRPGDGSPRRHGTLPHPRTASRPGPQPPNPSPLGWKRGAWGPCAAHTPLDQNTQNSKTPPLNRSGERAGRWGSFAALMLLLGIASMVAGWLTLAGPVQAAPAETVA